MAQGIIFDVDGTLVDSNDAHARAWVAAGAFAGFRVSFADVRPLIGVGGDKLLPALFKVDPAGTVGKAIAKARGRIFREEEIKTVRPFPMVRELLTSLRERGIGLAVASSAKKEELKLLLSIANIADLLEEKTSSDDADSSKPDPDIVIAALARLGYASHEVLMVGDTPFDAEAARRAEVRFVAVRCGGWRDRDFPTAAAIYDGPPDILRRIATLPWRSVPAGT
jgi:HAD superfamily hydrolase (TIGR01509 family)